MKIYKYVLRRLLLALFVLLGVTILTFVLTRSLSRVDPIVIYVDLHTPVERYAQIRAQHGLDRPLYIQYGYYLRDLLRGDLGYARGSGAPVTVMMRRLLPATLELSIVAILFCIGIGVPLGLAAALRHGTRFDHAVRGLSIGAVSLPSFWFGLTAQLLFFYVLRVYGLPHLPSSGRIDESILLDRPLRESTGFLILDSLRQWHLPALQSTRQHLVLPGLTLALFPMGLLVRVVRVATLEVLAKEFVLFARSKGIAGYNLLVQHVLRNALIPVVTALGLITGRLVSGSVIVENVFSWPGLGSWAARSILSNDLAAVMGFVLVVTTAYVLINLLVDISYQWLDPRIRY